MVRSLLLLVLTPLLALSQSNGPAAPQNSLPGDGPGVSAAAAAEPAGSPTVERILQPPEPGRFRKLFEQFRTERATLSPDGRYLAYSVREDASLYVHVVDCDQPATLKARVQVGTDDGATLRLGTFQREDTPARILWMRWVSANRLVVGTNERFLQGTGAIVAFDADGGNARILATPRDMFQRPVLPVEFAISRDRDKPIGRTPDMSDAEARFLGAARVLGALDQVQVEEAQALGAPLPSQNDISPLPTASTTEVLPDVLDVFDLDPERPAAVTLLHRSGDRGDSSFWMDFESLDTHTGKLTEIRTSILATRERTLLDRQGRPRISLPNATTYPYPLRYSYQGPEGHNRPKPLDTLAGAAGFDVSPENYFGERSVPLGFAEDPDILYFASNVGRDTHGIYSLNLRTGERGALTMENPGWDLMGAPGNPFPGDSLVFDRFSHELAGVRYQANRRTAAWIKPELIAVQAELEKALPGHSVEILEWDESGNRFLAVSDGPADPGAFHVYDRRTHRLMEYARRAPWVDEHHVYSTLPFGFTLANGTRLTGFVTIPSEPRMKPIPMILICPETPWARATPDYNREVHALAGMGFVVAQLNGRGAWGTGREQRQAITTGYDLVQVEDIVSAVDALTLRFQINPKRVALLGRGHGGFIALRAVQDHPEKFRCAIAMEPPVDLARWLADLEWNDRENVFAQLTKAWIGDAARLKAAPLVSAPEKITKPVLLFSYPRPDSHALRPAYLWTRNFARAVRRAGGTVEFSDLHHDYVQGLPGARAEVFDRIEEFLNLNIYDFRVKLEELKVVQR